MRIGIYILQRSLRLQVVGLNAIALVQAGADKAWPLPAFPTLSPDAFNAPCCSHIRLLATSNVLGIFMLLCFCTHCSYFLECSYSTSNGEILIQPQRPTSTSLSLQIPHSSYIFPWNTSLGLVVLAVSGWELSNFVCLMSRGKMRMFRTGK